MVCSEEILAKTIFGLALFVCRPTHSLETGCTYPSDDVSVDECTLHYDLKCTYLFSGLTHMLVTRHLSGPPSPRSLSSSIGKIVPYTHTVKCQIFSLYRLKAPRMDALWLLLLYLSMLNTFHGEASNKKEAGQKMFGTHGFVIDQLRKDLTGCREDNSFNQERKIDNPKGIAWEKASKFLMRTNVDRANELLARNDICDKAYYDNVGNALQVGTLFLNNIGSKDTFVEDLMNAFNVQVEWSGAGERMEKAWQEAHVLNWPVNFKYLKLYFKLVFDFLKIIIFRLSLKHLDYLEPFSDEDLLYVHYAQEWYNKVKEFSDMLSLSEDLHVSDLLVHLDNLVKKTETTQSVARYLIRILEKLCTLFGCKATGKFQLDGKELQTPFKSTISRADLKITQYPVLIDYHSLENTRVYLCYLKWMFKFCNLNLIQLLVEYVNGV